MIEIDRAENTPRRIDPKAAVTTHFVTIEESNRTHPCRVGRSRVHIVGVGTVVANEHMGFQSVLGMRGVRIMHSDDQLATRMTLAVRQGEA